MQRRDFLQLSGVATGAILLGATSVAAQAQETSYPDPEGSVT